VQLFRNYFHSVHPVMCHMQKVSVNTTNVVIQSINTQIEFFIFLPLHVWVLMGPSSGNNYDRTTKII
jgi:hypothetical protein